MVELRIRVRKRGGSEQNACAPRAGRSIGRSCRAATGSVVIALTCTTVGGVPGQAHAQSLQEPARDSLRVEVSALAPASAGVVGRAGSSPGGSRALVTERELWTGVGLAAGTALLLPLDMSITERLRAPGIQASRPWRSSMAVVDRFGAPGAQVAGPALFGTGLVLRSPSLRDAGLHVTESYVIAGAATFVLKGLAGRGRPYWPKWESATDFKLGRGFPHREPYSSFPSGHATGMFAAASAITAEAGHWWPEHARLIGTVAYGAAVLDGVSRVYRDTHWPSDVAAGALVGTLTGMLVSRHSHARRDDARKSAGDRADQRSGALHVWPASPTEWRVGWAGTF